MLSNQILAAMVSVSTVAAINIVPDTSFDASSNTNMAVYWVNRFLECCYFSLTAQLGSRSFSAKAGTFLCRLKHRYHTDWFLEHLPGSGRRRLPGDKLWKPMRFRDLQKQRWFLEPLAFQLPQHWSRYQNMPSLRQEGLAFFGRSHSY